MIDVETLDEAGAVVELARLRANRPCQSAYYQDDAPEITDAEYDALKVRNTRIEQRFPALKRDDSPSESVGAPPWLPLIKSPMQSRCYPWRMPSRQRIYLILTRGYASF